MVSCWMVGSKRLIGLARRSWNHGVKTVPGFERLQSTFQSIRRRAIVMVRPRGAGYTIEVVVQKDLEDAVGGQHTAESASVMRHDGTIVRKDDNFDDSAQTLGWIPLGRDTSLEQVILRDIFGRITQADRNRLRKR
jgi:hypothetical protein